MSCGFLKSVTMGSKLVSLLPADIVGGNILIVGANGVEKGLLNDVSKKAGKLTIIENEGTAAILDEIRRNLNCEVDYIKKEHVIGVNYSLVIICNGTFDVALASMCLSWLLPDGYAMLVTHCAQIDESVVDNTDNQTTYSLDRVFKSTPSVNSFGFVFVASRIIETYEDRRVLYSSVFKKIIIEPGKDRRLESLHDVLNDRTYTKKIIQLLQRIFSRDGDPGFISTGGAEITEECLRRLELQSGQRVLDVGCGAGGPAILNAKKYKAHVIGVDISSNMIDAATEATANQPDLNIEFEVCDIERREFPEGYFDAIYSKDSILHIVRKQALFKKFLKWLKPGGKLLITDYCRTENEFSDIMQGYMKERANVWFLISRSVYGQHLKEAGFIKVDVQDKHAVFRECLVKENIHLVNKRDDLLKEFDQPFLDDWIGIWKSKVKLLDNRDLTWGVFYAEKCD